MSYFHVPRLLSISQAPRYRDFYYVSSVPGFTPIIAQDDYIVFSWWFGDGWMELDLLGSVHIFWIDNKFKCDV